MWAFVFGSAIHSGRLIYAGFLRYNSVVTSWANPRQGRAHLALGPGAAHGVLYPAGNKPNNKGEQRALRRSLALSVVYLRSRFAGAARRVAALTLKHACKPTQDRAGAAPC